MKDRTGVKMAGLFAVAFGLVVTALVISNGVPDWTPGQSMPPATSIPAPVLVPEKPVRSVTMIEWGPTNQDRSTTDLVFSLIMGVFFVFLLRKTTKTLRIKFDKGWWNLVGLLFYLGFLAIGIWVGGQLKTGSLLPTIRVPRIPTLAVLGISPFVGLVAFGVVKSQTRKGERTITIFLSVTLGPIILGIVYIVFYGADWFDLFF